MTSPSPIVEINSTSLGGWTSTVAGGVAVAAGETVSVRLADHAGDGVWHLSVTGTDDQVSAPTITQAATAAGTATFVAPTDPSSGWGLIIQSQIGNNSLGHDVNGRVNPSYTTSFKVYLPTAGNQQVLCANESLEGNPTTGWVGAVNNTIRSPGGPPSGSAGGDWSGSFPTGVNKQINGQRVPWKSTVKCVATANLTLSGEQTIDGVTTSASRILVAGQTTAANNGIYVTASGAWARASDMAASADALPGTTVHVSEGTAYKNSTWKLGTTGAVTLGSTALSFYLADTVVDVERFGAKFDGTSDDYAGIQAAIDACTNGGIVQLPPRAGKCSATLSITRDGIVIQGTAQATSVSMTADVPFLEGNPVGPAITLYFCGLRGVTLNMHAAAHDVTLVDESNFTHFTLSEARLVLSAGANTSAIYMDGTTFPQFNINEQIFIVGGSGTGSRGIYLHSGGPGLNGVGHKFDTIEIQSVDIAVDLDGADRCVCFGVITNVIAVSHYRLSLAAACQIIAARCEESNTSYAVKFDSSTGTPIDNHIDIASTGNMAASGAASVVDPSSMQDWWLNGNRPYYHGAPIVDPKWYAFGTSALSLSHTLSAPRVLHVPDPGGPGSLPSATQISPSLAMRCAYQADSTASDVAGIVADFNSLLAKLQATNVMRPKVATKGSVDPAWWVMADYGVTRDPTTNLVSAWDDVSGNTYAISSIGDLKYIPGITPTGKPAMYFDSSAPTTFSLGTQLNGLTEAEIFVVIKAFASPATSGNDGPWAHVNGSSSVGNYPDTSGHIQESFASQAAHDAGAIDTGWHIENIISTSTEYTVKIDGVQTVTTGTNVVDFTDGSLIIGGRTSHFFHGYIAEIVILPSKQSGGDRTAWATTYLKAKYGTP